MVQNTKDVRYLYVLSNYDKLPEVEDSVISAWFEIYKSWSEIIGGSRSDLTLLRHKRMLAMKQMYNVHSIMLNMVETLPIPEIVEMFNEEGYSIEVDNLEESVKVARGKLNRKKAQIELDEDRGEEEESGDFDSVIVMLEKYQGYGFDQEKMSVRHFANIYKNFKEDGKGRENKKK